MMNLDILSIGDIYLNREDPKHVFSDIKSVSNDSDVVFGNLEAPLTREDSVRPLKFGAPGLRSDPEMISGLLYAGFQIVSLANNHIMDYGGKGLIETLDMLEANGIAHVGAGRNIEEAEEPTILERDGIKIAFVAFEATPLMYVGEPGKDTPGVNRIRVSPLYEEPHISSFDLEKAMKQIEFAASIGDLMIACFHWGVPPCEEVTVYQKALGRKAVDSGAHLVIGHHPHVLQGVEIYEDSVICYSLGNFVFDIDPTIHPRYGWGDETAILKCSFSREGIDNASLIPATSPHNNKDKVRLFRADGERGSKISERLIHLSKRFKTALSIDGEEILIHI